MTSVASEKNNTRGKDIAGLAICVVICFLAPACGAFWPPSDWYASLQKPSWNPPGWVFGPVWSLLYTMMAVSVWQIWRRGGFTQHRWPLSVFIVQLIFNALWTPLFFGLHQPLWALIDIVLLWMAIVATSVLFWRVHKLAAILLVPYLAWVSFATVLNITLWQMNS